MLSTFKCISQFYQVLNDMKLLLGLAVAILAALPSTALAADWVLVGESQDGNNRIFVDANSMVRGGATISDWTLFVNSLPNEKGVTSYQGYESMDCRRRVVQVKEVISRDSAGGVISSQEFSDLPLERVVPGSNRESIFQAVCSR